MSAFRMMRCAAPWVLMLSLGLGGTSLGQDNDSLPRSGIASRVPWTTSRLVGRPSPPLPYQAVRVFDKVSLQAPLHLITEPSGAVGSPIGKPERFFVVEQKGRIVSFRNSAEAIEADMFVTIEDHDTYGMTFHPRYAQNRWVYVFSNGPQSDPKERRNRVTRFTVRDQPPFDCDRDSALIVIEWDSNGHNGGDLAFGPDGMLYISAGDGTTDSDTNLTGQKISDLVSGMLRIDVETSTSDRPYSIPQDNPFLDIPGARGELWAYGFRNPWRIHFDPAGHLWCGDIGQDQYEMIELVERGDNYGWSVVEGGHPFYSERQPGPTPIKAPAIVHPHSEARSITGGVTYLGKKFPDLHGAYIYGDYGTGKIWAARAVKGKVTEVREIADTPYQILGFGLDARGEIYFVDYGGKAIYSLEAIPPSQVSPENFPRKLSETGLFTDVARHQLHPGVIPYSVNSPLWSDGADKARFLALPHDATIEFTESGAWKFPEGSVLVKSFSLPTAGAEGPVHRWVETRVMVIQQNEWVGYSYRWNDEQTDAELVEESGIDQAFVVADPDAENGHRQQVWHYPSRAECMVCHSRAAGYVLGLSTEQMNRIHDYEGIRANQLTTLEHLGLFRGKGQEAGRLPKPVSELERLTDPADPNAPIEARVRSYLHSNCAHCHVEAGGGNAAMELGWKTPTDKSRIVDVVPLHDKFQIPEARLIAPGSPDSSVLRKRLTLRGRGQMPPLATSRVDRQAVELLDAWIRSLAP
ncbi:MAG: PQQ-dependent sugar dehydrogenase [Planctomycetaceae bacterium]|jgi:uncharacterized repeat protein (TIGR03806 family)